MNQTTNKGARERRSALLDTLPTTWRADLRPAIREAVARTGRKVVVLDDDPTGTQTVHGVPVLTSWTVERLSEELRNDGSVFYILTNSRSLTPEAARSLNLEIGQNLSLAGKQAGRDFTVVSRSDSTLRGHFPAENEALGEVLGGFDAVLLVPFFEAGGRYTIGDIHYVAEGDWLVPAAETQFARDSVFGYRHSNLRAWVEEKTGGSVRADEVASISLDDIRRGGPERVATRLRELRRGVYCIVNAASQQDLDVLVLGLLKVELEGRRFLYRTAASFVAARAGLAERPLLTPEELGLATTGGGLVVVGSYVPKSSEQLERLLKATTISSIEVSVDNLLTDGEREAEISRAATAAEGALKQDRDVAVYTSRRLRTTQSAAGNLDIGRRVSESLVQIVRAISTRPRYLLAKGGITSSDMATEAMGVERAWVLGQVLPGVPVWRLGPESRFPGLPYIVFPGNVGGPDALAQIVSTWHA